MVAVGSDPAFTRHVDDIYHRDLDGLFSAGEMVRALMTHPGWPTLARVLEAEIATIDSQLDGRLLDSRAAYAHAHGRRGGLRALDEAARAIVSRAESRLAEQQRKHEGAAEPAPVG